MDNLLKYTVLLVEDSDEDVLMLKRAFGKAHLANPLNVVKDGEEAIKYLSGIGAYHGYFNLDRLHPSIVFSNAFLKTGLGNSGAPAGLAHPAPVFPSSYLPGLAA